MTGGGKCKPALVLYGCLIRMPGSFAKQYLIILILNAWMATVATVTNHPRSPSLPTPTQTQASPDLIAQLAAANATIAQLQQLLQDSQAARAELEADLAAASAQLEASADVAEVRAQLAATQQRLNGTTTALDTTEGLLAEARAQWHTAVDEREAAKEATGE